MEIPVHHILRKMDEEIKQALSKNDQTEIRDHLVSIKTLCNIVLDKKNKNFEENDSNKKPITPLFTKRKAELEEEDGNGESLFDF